MYGLETEVITLHTCRRRCPLCSGLLQNPDRLPTLLPPRQGAPAWVFSLEAQGLLLVPRPRSRITGPSLSVENPLFNMFTMAALKPHCFSVFALLFISFPLLLLAQDVFTVREMLMIMSSIWCVHGEKKQNTRDKKGYKNY